MTEKKKTQKSICLYPSDKNGCGFYRTFLPFRYLSSVHPEYHTTEFVAYNWDLTYMQGSKWIRFQRQSTDNQTTIIKEIKNTIRKYGMKTRIAYDIDDLVHGIEPENILAYQFYTPSRKQNMIDIFRISDRVTFSTKFLKDYYKSNFDINNSVVIPNYLPKFLWEHCGKRDKSKKGKKPRILWAGSASHVAKGGDLDFLVPLIKKTKDEFEWVFFGCKPFELEGQVEFHPWANFYSYPNAIDSIDADFAICPIKDCEFNYAKSDLKLLEYTAIGLPAIFSGIGNGQGPYDLAPGTKTVENKIDSWYQALKEFAKDDGTKEKYLENGKKILAKRWLEDNIDIYAKLYS